MDNWGKGKARRRTSAANWKLPLKWNNRAHLLIECVGCGHRHILPEGLESSFCPECEHPEGVTVRPRVFCASLADWLDDEVPIEWLADLLKLIHDTPNLDWLLLTKRPEKWRARLGQALAHYAIHRGGEAGPWLHDWLFVDKEPQNVWIGASVENQEMANRRIPALLKIPAKVRFLSVEPMLGEINIQQDAFDYVQCHGCRKWSGKYDDTDSDGNGPICPKCQSNDLMESFLDPGDGIDWVICGGESGSRKRTFNCDWARSLRDQCKAAGVAFFMKQVDKVQLIPQDLMTREFPV